MGSRKRERKRERESERASERERDSERERERVRARAREGLGRLKSRMSNSRPNEVICAACRRTTRCALESVHSDERFQLDVVLNGGRH